MQALTRHPDLTRALAVLLAVTGAALLRPAESADRSLPVSLHLPRLAAPAHVRAPVALRPPESVPALIRAVFGERSRDALCVAGAESGWEPLAVNVNDDGAEDRGVFQINSRWHPHVRDAEAFDPAANVRYAHALSHGGTDWSAWSDTTRERCGLT
jgi:hypothetical protein